jgi:putative component of membrane protein insertase Oxa1/YidC/SpoIIIJ protein YidD
MPTYNSNEYETARAYCLNHNLNRPKTSVLTAIMLVLTIELSALLLATVLYFVFVWLGISLSFSEFYLITSNLLFLLFIKKISITAIELYQHYAPEITRRKCVLMPSCSEYALLALQKYNVIKALYKTYIRLTLKCRGGYEIDYP